MKEIVFDLPINGTKVRNLDELTENLTDEIINIARTGRLQKWLRIRKHNDLAERVGDAETANSDDRSLLLALCEILQVKCDQDDIDAIFNPAPPAGKKVKEAAQYHMYEGSPAQQMQIIENAKALVGPGAIDSPTAQRVGVFMPGNATITSWLKRVGDRINCGEVICKSDNYIVTAPVTGTLWSILRSAETTVMAGNVIAEIKR